MNPDRHASSVATHRTKITRSCREVEAGRRPYRFAHHAMVGCTAFAAVTTTGVSSARAWRVRAARASHWVGDAPRTLIVAFPLNRACRKYRRIPTITKARCRHEHKSLFRLLCLPARALRRLGTRPQTAEGSERGPAAIRRQPIGWSSDARAHHDPEADARAV